ncbi:MAG: hypothetical protein JWP48_3292 [Actinoallomurus sp.]|jgi:uncharacterized protein (DUF2236 family)|nr:hypothetical protein [Actinoallomurus sp.]
MGGTFGDDAVIHWVAAEPALLAGGGRALLLQLAHPKVARGVADHSDFASDRRRCLLIQKRSGAGVAGGVGRSPQTVSRWSDRPREANCSAGRW